MIGFRNKATGRIGAWRFQNPAVRDQSGAIRHEASPRIVFDDGLAAYDLACNGYGIVWAPAWLALEDVRSGRVTERVNDFDASFCLI